ncbi:uncharacterized protein LOC127251748 isoform X2 [Andrographis paniculata]|uniref:uncharacterized protein LOC127251748 isoform X2 n=1 Tax=Andrographis paniculata TaxID=175694 RepID=UPI0021E7072E|nr:uncharacterized protein LOC127251748 isoform X2 [Andrographis paniculata]
MSRLPEINSLFAAVGSYLRSQDSTARVDVDSSVSDLNRSLNLHEVPRVRILDTALSLMCFTAPQVLRVGGMVSKSDCADIMEACVDILKKIEGQKGDLCNSLLYAVIRMASLAPCFQRVTPSSINFGMKINDPRILAAANLLGHGRDEFNFGNEVVPLRLLLWHLDPINLKKDISEILQEIVERPFLSFSMEIHNRLEWRSKLLCLVVSPVMFIETRALLHSWFLMTGLASVMELQIDFAQQVLDVISKPMWWGLSMEVGLKLPFSQAYFPHEHHLSRILAGPICHEYFQLLLNKLDGPEALYGSHLRTHSKEAETKLNAIDHKSVWALVLNFPQWFYFATMLLFYNESATESFSSATIALSAKPYIMHDVQVSKSTAAARFIAWFLNPIDLSFQSLMIDCLVKMSEVWTWKCSSSTKCDKGTRVHGKQITRFKLLDKDEKSSNEGNTWTVMLWLGELKSMYTRFLGTKSNTFISNTKELGTLQFLLVRRIPLGILLVHLNHLDEASCSLILHYAATGTILKLSDKPNMVQNQKRWKYNQCADSARRWIEQCTQSEAVEGCKTVFHITDVAETISPSKFETEEDALNFIFQLKLKASNYLLMCIKRLLQLNIDDEGINMQRDLSARLVRWRRQGKDVCPSKDMDFVCNALNI